MASGSRLEQVTNMLFRRSFSFLSRSSRSGKSRHDRHRYQPCLESLEVRLAPAGDILSNPVNVVTGLYKQILQRNPDPQGLKFWVNAIENGASVNAVAQGFWNSPEFRSIEVDNYYAHYLNRAPDPQGLAYWENQLLSGVPEEQVMVGFVSSPEFFTDADSANAVFVQDLYLDLLGRQPAATEQAAWVVQINNGMSRADVADSLVDSMEFRVVEVGQIYDWVLARSADPGGLQYWSTLPSGGSWLRSASLGILSSSENLDRLLVLTGITLPNPTLEALYKSMMASSYPNFVATLDANLGNPAFRQMMLSGEVDGSPGDEAAPVVLNVAVPVISLRPTQGEIGMANSLEDPLTNPTTLALYLKGGTISVGGANIVTGDNGAFIIDGHHRWSQLFVINPSAKILADDFPTLTDPTTALEASDLTIAGDTGTDPHKPLKGVNLLTVDVTTFSNYVATTIESNSDGGAAIMAVFAEYGIGDGTIASLPAVTAYLWGNVQLMQAHNQSILGAAAPPRILMPQTDTDPNFLSTLSSGQVNFRQLFFYSLGS